MPKGDKFKKQNNQPSVANIFTGKKSANSSASIISQNKDLGTQSSTPLATVQLSDLSDPTEDNRNFTPVNKNRRKKRRRETGDSTGKSSPNEMSSRNNSKKRSKIVKTMENKTTEKTSSTTPRMEVTDPETGPSDNPQNNNLSKEMKMMENRLYESLKTLLKDTIDTSLKLIQESIDKLQATQTTMETHERQIQKLQCDNATLTEEVTYLRSEVNEFQAKINKLEDKSLENNLIFHGLEEQSPDDIDSRNEKVYAVISSTINQDTPEERLQVAHEVEIVHTRRLGKAEPNRTRPLSVEFSSKYDAVQIFKNHFSIGNNIYVDREYCYETEKDRRLLRPILKAAKRLKDYNHKCRLDRNQLVLDGKRYTKETLYQLPKNLEIMKIMTKSDEHHVGFFGELCPLSNFHPSPFLFHGTDYHSTEQLIQHQKAKLCRDKQAERSILSAKTPLECKKLSREITNFSFKRWSENAKELCKEGIEAKFTQNPRLMQALFETGDKILIECAKDTLWGTGVPLNDPQCLNNKYWKTQRLLGTILQEIREKHLAIARTILPPINKWQSQGPPKLLRPRTVPCDPSTISALEPTQNSNQPNIASQSN